MAWRLQTSQLPARPAAWLRLTGQTMAFRRAIDHARGTGPGTSVRASACFPVSSRPPDGRQVCAGKPRYSGRPHAKMSPVPQVFKPEIRAAAGARPGREVRRGLQHAAPGEGVLGAGAWWSRCAGTETTWPGRAELPSGHNVRFDADPLKPLSLVCHWTRQTRMPRGVSRAAIPRRLGTVCSDQGALAAADRAADEQVRRRPWRLTRGWGITT